MGLRKPPKGGGVELPIVETPAGAADMAEGKQAINDVGTLIEGTLPVVASGETETLNNAGPSHASGNIRMTGTVAEDKILRAGSKVMTMVSGSFFGDATAADVASGKKFTSQNGLNQYGSLVVPAVNDWDPYEMEEEVMLDLTGYVSNGYLKASSSGSNYAAGTYILMSKTETTLTIGSGSIPIGGNLPVVKIKVDTTTTIYAGTGNTVAMLVKQ